LDKNHSDFHDHSLSSDPEEMRRLVCKIKSASEYLGHGKKGISAAEEKIKKQSRRSIVAAHDLNVGHKININDLDWIRPDHIHSLSPGDENKVLGKSLLRNIVKGDMISLEDID
jgi:sialic acid synthase SpsE